MVIVVSLDVLGWRFGCCCVGRHDGREVVDDIYLCRVKELTYFPK